MKRLASNATVVALVLSLLAAGYLIVVPTSKGVVTSASLAGAPTVTETRTTLIQDQGWSVLVPVMVPVLICLAASVLRRRRPARSIAAIALGTFVVLTGFSIGPLYAPSAAAMVVAALARSSA